MGVLGACSTPTVNVAKVLSWPAWARACCVRVRIKSWRSAWCCDSYKPGSLFGVRINDRPRAVCVPRRAKRVRYIDDRLGGICRALDRESITSPKMPPKGEMKRIRHLPNDRVLPNGRNSFWQQVLVVVVGGLILAGVIALVDFAKTVVPPTTSPTTDTAGDTTTSSTSPTATTARANDVAPSDGETALPLESEEHCELSASLREWRDPDDPFDNGELYSAVFVDLEHDCNEAWGYWKAEDPPTWNGFDLNGPRSSWIGGSNYRCGTASQVTLAFQLVDSDNQPISNIAYFSTEMPAC